MDTKGKTETPEITPEKFQTLARLALQFCDMVLITAPTFAEGSQGAKTVELARNVRGNLASMVVELARLANTGFDDSAGDSSKEDGKDDEQTT